MTPEPILKIFVNEDVSGTYVGIAIENPSMIEGVEGQLWPACQMPPMVAMRAAQILVDAAGKIIEAAKG